tara:strand:+ start:12201 stop:12458 length:258 start_codon:yes stop_codon:yes gene_type:complete
MIGERVIVTDPTVKDFFNTELTIEPSIELCNLWVLSDGAETIYLHGDQFELVKNMVQVSINNKLVNVTPQEKITLDAIVARNTKI